MAKKTPMTKSTQTRKNSEITKKINPRVRANKGGDVAPTSSTAAIES